MAQILRQKDADGYYILNFIHKGKQFIIYTQTLELKLVDIIQKDIKQDIRNGKLDRLAVGLYVSTYERLKDIVDGGPTSLLQHCVYVQCSNIEN